MNKNNDLKENDNKLSNVPEPNRQEAIAYYNRGVDCCIVGSYEEAIKDYSKAIELDGKFAHAYYGRGNVYYKKGANEEAIKDYSKAIELDGKFAHAYHGRGNAYFKKGSYEEAIKDYSQAIELDGKFVHAYHGRGNVYCEKGSYEEAIKDYSKAIELDDKFVHAYHGRGRAYCEKGANEEAIKDYSKAIELDGKFVHAYHGRGRAYCEKGLYEEAIKDYSKAIELNDKYTYAYHGRGIAYFKKGSYEEAIKDYSKAIELDSKFIPAYYNRGVAYFKKGLYEEAIKDFSQAIELDDKYAPAYHGRGNAYSKKGWYKKAIKDYSQAIELDDKYILGYNGRGVAYYEIGDFEKSQADFNTVLYLILSNESINLIRPIRPGRLIRAFDGYPHNCHTLFQYISLPTDSFFSQGPTSFISYWQRVSPIQDFLLLLHYYELQLPHEEFVSFYPILIYNLGGCSEAFKVFDEELDTGEQPLSAQQYYYFILSALSLSEDANLGQKNIITDAIDKVSTQKEPAPIDYYYLGMIHLLNNDKESAVQAFHCSSIPFSRIMTDSLNETTPSQELRHLLQNIHSKEIQPIDIEQGNLSQFEEYLHLLEVCYFPEMARKYLEKEVKMLWNAFELTEEARKELADKIRFLECKRFVSQLKTVSLSQEEFQRVESTILFETQNLSSKEEIEAKIVRLISSHGQDTTHREIILKLIQYHSYNGDIGAEEMFFLMLWFDRKISNKKSKNISATSMDIMIAIFSGCITHYLGNNSLFISCLGAAIPVIAGKFIENETSSEEMSYEEFKKQLFECSEVDDLIKLINKSGYCRPIKVV
ncbi:lipopolysaccharide assembly protein B [Porphyromonas gingivalis]|uniref:tetratricopeptide repeat protein n=1 Tax=Porphyromonas gingivalis TaxID=837 RepID=UPI0030A23116